MSGWDRRHMAGVAFAFCCCPQEELGLGRKKKKKKREKTRRGFSDGDFAKGYPSAIVWPFAARRGETADEERDPTPGLHLQGQQIQVWHLTKGFSFFRQQVPGAWETRMSDEQKSAVLRQVSARPRRSRTQKGSRDSLAGVSPALHSSTCVVCADCSLHAHAVPHPASSPN